MSLLVTVGAALAAAPVGWWRAPPPPGPLLDAAAHDDEVFAVTRDGALVVFRDERWTELAAPNPTSEAAIGIAVHEGVPAVFTGIPPILLPFDEAAATWGERQPVPVRGITDVVSTPRGRVASGLHGTSAAQVDGVWSALPERDGHLMVRSDRSGGLWWWQSSPDAQGLVFRTDAAGVELERGPALPQWSRYEPTLDVDANGRPIWGGDGLFRLDAQGEIETLGTAFVASAVASPVLWAVSTSGSTADLEPASVPVPFTRMGRTADGAWGLGPDGDLYLTRASALALTDVTQDWGAAALFGIRSSVGDFDGDGLDDVLTTENDCRSRLWLQRADHFEDATDAWGFPPCTLQAAVGDLDGDGRPDLVTLERTPGETRRLEAFRNLGRFEHVTARAFQGTTRDEASPFGIPQLLDVDDDGDLDVVASAQGTPGAPARVWVWANDGLGRLTTVPLSERGLGYASYVGRIHAADLDGDGDGDFVLQSFWGTGHHVLERLDDGTLRDVSRTAGLRGVYGVALEGILADLDRDGDADLLTAGKEPPHVWRNRGDLGFDGATDAFGLSGAPSLRTIAVADLDADGWPDLAGCSDDGCTTWVGGPDGFRVASGALPRSGLSARALVNLDLGADGDPDLLLLQTDRAVLLENQGPAAASPVRRSVPFGVFRRLRWATAVDVGLVAGWFVWIGALVFGVRRAGSRLALGQPVVAAATLGAGPMLWLAFADQIAAARIAGGVVAAVVAGLGGAAEIRASRARQARRAGNYLIERELGRGGMGTVHVARDLVSGERVALKLVDPRLLENEEDFELYRDEARIGSEIRHPGVVRILGWGEWTTTVHGEPVRTAYLAMELIDGPTLKDWAHAQDRVAVSDATSIVAAVCRALAVIHSLDVVHRDIKPSNIMLGPDQRVVVMDFGAARYVGQVTRHTRSVLGTLGYMAPEQGRGQAADPRSDVYAAGVVLYELLTGRRPFEADNMVSLMARVVSEPVPPVQRDDVPAELAAVLDRMLAKTPEERPRAREVVDLLQPWCGGDWQAHTGGVAPDDTTQTATGVSDA